MVDANGVTLGDIDDGTILYIDPNDPQAAEILQQAGLQLAEDGTVSSIDPSGGEPIPVSEAIDTAGMDLMAQAAHASQLSAADVAGEAEVEQAVVEDAGESKPVQLEIKPEVSNGGQQILEQAFVSALA